MNQLTQIASTPAGLPPSDVDVHPQGASPFGVMDMVGNVWQWTDEYLDEHTRAAIVLSRSIRRQVS
ncbi:SUMF1/EgtB/PvdO family nonheme iron enzyme [Tunturibacter empetritectus]|uniref:Formylglycine-generating enzyme required for sulfatase activity n=1 Tax=Tunturiibacter empetritectus TaxID=3069691 RepID=A0A7W8MS96_9BACT|nr:SUMF1/EgtB/PvdO family nonheme iron enzyme [Edaphobacter lichenicola]MBB5318117.1 formylglycine-generating enzyme required for sulfatase activity [Edaphobacter lichenicola]